MTDKYAVIGNPIAHSKSPQIHAMFAQQTGQDISYEAMLAPLGLGEFWSVVNNFFKQGGKGMNVTVPFKVEAFQNADKQSPRAQHAQAANTLTLINGKLVTDNTDGVGLIRDIQINRKIPLADKRVLLLGAGGAAQGVLYPLLEQNPSLLHIANRTKQKAVVFITTPELAEVMGSTLVQAKAFSELHDQQYDIIVNATSAGLMDEMPDIPKTLFAPGALAYDMMYGR
ncbi:MAG: shikimate dehydrogenase, partial [Gallionellaceae bacterium]|nr:shikimate dehydrogenase [Gallionellaceae bacterium]